MWKRCYWGEGILSNIFWWVSHNSSKIRSVLPQEVKLISIFRFGYGYETSINRVSKLGSFCDLENIKSFEIRKLTSAPFKTYDIHYSVVNRPEHVFIFVLYFLNLLLTWPKCNQQGVHRSYHWKLFYYCLTLSEHFTSAQLLRNSQNSVNIQLLFKKTV